MTDFEKLAVVIGINHYDHGIPPLETPVDDAKAIAEVLKDEHSYNQIDLVLEQKANLRNIEDLLKNLSKVVKENTCLLFYFAGHGIALNGDEGPEGYLIPQDAVLGDTSTYLPMPIVEKALTTLPCRHCLIILDCCFAGAFQWSSTRHIAAIPKIIYRERYERYTTDPAWQVIASSAHDQKAIDALAITKERDLKPIDDEVDGRRHSPFAKALLDALRGEADTYPPAKDGKGPGDGIITATELYWYVRDHVEDLTFKLNRRQTPVLWSLKKHDKGEYIFLTKAFNPKSLAPAPLLDEKRENNPYRGLEPYEREHSNLFFGRTKLIEKLCDAVCDRPITVVLGASGAGKSSLVKAGLVSHLEQSDEQGKQVQNRSLKSTTEAHQHKHQLWRILSPLRPTESPLNGLSQLVKTLDETGKDATAAINFTPQLLSEAVEDWRMLRPDSKLLVIIDQVEELVTLCHDEQERGLFLQILIRAAIAHPKHFRIIFTLRSDFEPQIRDKFEVQIKAQQRIEPLLDAQPAKPNSKEETTQEIPQKKYLPELVWRNARFIVPAMSRDELREVIEEPALTKVIFFKPHTLVDQLIDEVAQMPGALPLLSFTLSELYLKLVRRYQSAEAKEEIIERAITQEDYVEHGGVTRALTQRADKEYKQLVKQDPAYAKTIRNVMLRMVALGGDLARRRVLLSELNYPEPENTRVVAVIQCFSAARLLIPDTDAQRQPTIEPAHDALIRGWSNIQNWKNEDQEELALQWLLTPAAQEWKNNKYKNGFLWDENPRIILLKQVLKRKHNWLNFLESEFVKKSLQHRRNSRLRLAVFAVGTISTLAGISVFALMQLQLSVLREIQEKAARVINKVSVEPLNSLLLAIEVTDESASRLGEVISPVQYSLSSAVLGAKEQNLLRGHEGTVSSVAFSPNSQLIASSGEDGTIRLWNLAGQSVGVFKGHEQITLPYSNNVSKNVSSLAFSPDGKSIVSGGDDGTVRLWDLQGNQLAPLGRFSVPIDSVAFHPDGNKVAVSSDNGTDAWLIDLSVNSVQTLQNPLGASGSNGNTVRFTPDGKFIVKQAGGVLSVFNFAGELLDEVGVADRSGHLNCSLAIVDRPDRGAYRIYSGQCRHYGSMEVAEYEVEEFYLDSEGRLGIAAEGIEGLKSDLNCEAEIFSLDATSSGTLISGCEDSVISMSQESTEVPTFLRGHTASVSAVAISPNEKHLVSADSNGTIRLWDLSDFFHVVELPYRSPQYQGESIAMEYYYDWTYDVAFDPKGEFWAIARQKTVMLFDMQGNLAARPFEHNTSVDLVAFNPKNRTILSVEGSALQGSTLRLWDLQGNLIRDFEVDRASKSIAFSPDGQMILSGDEEGTLSLWSLSGQKIGEFKGHENAVRAVSFSPDGQSIISGSDDDTLRLWNLQGSTLRIFKGHDDDVTSLAFSPDGRSIISGSDDHTLRLWNLNNEATTLFRGHTASVRTVAFNPTGNIIVSAGSDPAVRFWSIDGSTMAPPFEPTMTFNASYSMAAISPDGKTIVSSVSEGAREWGGRLFLIRGWSSWEEWLGKACDRLRYHPVLLNPATPDQRKAHDACKRRSGANQ